MRMKFGVTVCLAVLAAGCGSSAGVTSGTADGDGRPWPSGGSASGANPGSGAPSGGDGTPAPADTRLGAPYPVVLVHGMAGFDKLTVGPVSVDYWNHVRDALARDGEFEVFETVAPPYDTSEIRAVAIMSQLQDILKKTNRKKLNLIGHSQGGMDARVLASPNGYGMGDVLASVTTISTPHRGSKVADVALGLIPGFASNTLNDAASALLGVLEKSVYDIQSSTNLMAQAQELTTPYMANTFNPKYIDAPGVYYASYAGRTNLRSGTGVCDTSTFPNMPNQLDAAQPLMVPTALLLEEGKGVVNDGLVTVDSAKWGEFMQCVPADHLQEVGNINVSGATATTFNFEQFYRDVVQRLRQKGF